MHQITCKPGHKWLSWMQVWLVHLIILACDFAKNWHCCLVCKCFVLVKCCLCEQAFHFKNFIYVMLHFWKVESSPTVGTEHLEKILPQLVSKHLLVQHYLEVEKIDKIAISLMNPEGLPQGVLVALFSTKIALCSDVPTNFSYFFPSLTYLSTMVFHHQHPPPQRKFLDI